jgi:enediyne biosynthesis protein E4
MSESGDRTESGDSAIFSSGGLKYKIEYLIYNFPYLFTGLLTTLGLLTYMILNKHFKWKCFLIMITPLLVGTVITAYQLMPKPRRYYFLSILKGDKGTEIEFARQRTTDGPMVGSSVLTINGKDHIFIGGGQDQDDQLLEYNNETNRMIDIIKKTNISSREPTYSAVSVDMDGNGYDDLLVGRKSGVYLYKYMGNYNFVETKIYNSDGDDKIPLALSVSDYNKDGKPDVYVSYFINFNKYEGTIFNKPSHNRGNVLLENRSKTRPKFIDVTTKTKAQGDGNTFTSVFVDLDNDGWTDIVTAHDSADIEILRNKGGKEFESIKPFKGKGNWMGIGVGDYDNDGDMDLFFTNLGTDTSKDKMSIGDLKPNQKQEFSHILLQNDGDFKFVDVTQKSGISGEGFGWGAVFTDLNNNSNLELLFADKLHVNPTHKILPSPGYYYVKNKSGKYERQFKYANPYSGQTPVIADINNDNIKDVIWINMQGPALFYLGKPNDNNYLNVRLPESNEFLNATVTLDTGQKVYTRQILQGGVGFGTNQTNLINFGLGQNKQVKNVTVKTVAGKIYSVNNPKINTQLTLKQFK